MPRIAAILIYPVEGCRGVRVKGCALTSRGLDGDRRWKVIAEDGAPFTGDQARVLGKVWVEQTGSQLWASAAGLDRLLLVPEACEGAGAWFSRLLSRPVRATRLAHADFSGPMVATTTASLAALNQQLPKSVTVDVFRPNFVLEGTDPFVEDTWTAVSVGGVRCAVAPNPHSLRPQFGITLEPALAGAASVQLRAGQSLEIASQEPHPA
jgi:uncharacterized protein